METVAIIEKNHTQHCKRFCKTLDSAQIEALGFNHWFRDRIDPDMPADRQIARVVAVHKDLYTISDGRSDRLAELVGRMLYGAQSPLDYPTVGDWVLASIYDAPAASIIHGIVPRKSLLKRKSSGKKVEYQLIAANIDTAFIVQSLDENFNLRRLERYLVMTSQSHIEPVVLLSKSDLIDAETLTDRIEAIRQIMPNLPVHPFSNLTDSGVAIVTTQLVPGRTYCLLGSSGVGKTTLLNRLAGAPLFKTKRVREKDSKGRHATTTRQLIQLDCGAMMVDTPGMRELGNISVKSGIEETFAEIAALSQHCRFRDCTHVSEKGCAVLYAVKANRLSEKRYQNYIKLTKESAFHEMSILERKRKDKAFGKMCKRVMKQKKNRR